MAGSGPSQRHASITTLVYSTLGSGLGLLPEEDKSDWVVIEKQEKREAAVVKPADAAADKEVSSTTTRPHGNNDAQLLRTSTTSAAARPATTSKELTEEVAKTGSANNTRNEEGEVLCRLYSSPASISNMAERKRADRFFHAKVGAGSVSSIEQAGLAKQTSVSSIVEDYTEPRSPVPVVAAKQLQGHISPRTLVMDPK